MSVLAVIPSWANTTSVEALPESGCLPRPSPTQVVYVKDEPGEAIFRDPVAGLLLPTKVRVSTQDVQNVFTGSDVNPVAGQEVQGISVLIQLTEVWREGAQTETEAPLPLCPVSAHLVLKLPRSSLITSSEVEKLVARLLGSIIRVDDGTWSDAIAPVLVGATRLAVPDPEAV
jgi:hypothetical protein